LSKLPVYFLLINLLSWFCLWDHYYEHMISAKRYSIKVEQLLFGSQNITIQIDVTVLSVARRRLYEEQSIIHCNFTVLRSYSHSSNLYIVCRRQSSFSYCDLILFYFIVYSSAELGILVQVRQMGLGFIEF
jgi:hypothetical protein